MPALDALKALWILVAFILLFFCIPARLFAGRSNSVMSMRVAGNLARAVLCVTIAVFLLARLRLLGTITVILLSVGALVIDWLRRRAEMPGGLLMSLQAAVIAFVRKVEARSFGSYPLRRKNPPVSGRSFSVLRFGRWLKGVEGKEMLIACLAVALVTSMVLRAEHAVRELRFDQPEQYSALLRARELMLNLHPADRPFVFPAVIAATSLLSGADPIQVTRFLSPVVELLVVLATGLLIRVSARVDVACVAVFYCLGAAAFPPARSDVVVATTAMGRIKSVLSNSPAVMRASTEFGLGLLFLLLALALLADWYKNARGWGSLLDFACCLLLTGIVSQFLLLMGMVVAGVVLLRPMAGLVALGLMCYGLAAYAAFSTSMTVPDGIGAILPVAAAILVGCFLGLIEGKLVAHAGRRAQTLLLTVCLFVAITWLHPQRLLGRYLEYEAAARVTQEIAYSFPRQAWVVVAPVEQLAETLGLGAHEDLAEFVEKYRGRVLSPEFRFQDGQQDLFIYVEKRPFQIFSREPETVSFSVLMDPTYRSYRSPGGRASVEEAALQLCESYRQYHPDADIFFENEDLLVYHVHQQRASEIAR